MLGLTSAPTDARGGTLDMLVSTELVVVIVCVSGKVSVSVDVNVVTVVSIVEVNVVMEESSVKSEAIETE